jgi:hypothetical protein
LQFSRGQIVLRTVGLGRVSLGRKIGKYHEKHPGQY